MFSDNQKKVFILKKFYVYLPKSKGKFMKPQIFFVVVFLVGAVIVSFNLSSSNPKQRSFIATTSPTDDVNPLSSFFFHRLNSQSPPQDDFTKNNYFDNQKPSSFIESEKVYSTALLLNGEKRTSSSSTSVVVISTGEMRSWDRCGPRLRKSLLEPNNALLTLFTFPGFLAQDYLNKNFETFYEPYFENKNLIDGKKKMKTVKKNQRNNNFESNQRASLDLIPKFSLEDHHRKLLDVYGEEHLALSVLLNSSKFVELAKKKAPDVTFYHFFTVLAQWAVIELAADRTLSLLSSSSSKTSKNYIFIRLRPDIFIVGTKILFSISENEKLFKIQMSCGGEENVASRKEKKKKSSSKIGDDDSDSSFNYEFSDSINSISKTFLRTTPFPEEEWPHDPLSDFSSVFVVTSAAQQESFESLISSSPVANRGFRLWSWMIGGRTTPPISSFSYVSPEKVTTNFTEEVGLKTKKIPIRWHFLLRQEMYNKVKRPKFKVEKGLRALVKKVFRTDDPNEVHCPPLT